MKLKGIPFGVQRRCKICSFTVFLNCSDTLKSIIKNRMDSYSRYAAIFIARQYATHAQRDIVLPIPSVRPSVRPCIRLSVQYRY